MHLHDRHRPVASRRRRVEHQRRVVLVVVVVSKELLAGGGARDERAALRASRQQRRRRPRQARAAAGRARGEQRREAVPVLVAHRHERVVRHLPLRRQRSALRLCQTGDHRTGAVPPREQERVEAAQQRRVALPQRRAAGRPLLPGPAAIRPARRGEAQRSVAEPAPQPPQRTARVLALLEQAAAVVPLAPNAVGQAVRQEAAQRRRTVAVAALPRSFRHTAARAAGDERRAGREERGERSLVDTAGKRRPPARRAARPPLAALAVGGVVDVRAADVRSAIRVPRARLAVAGAAAVGCLQAEGAVGIPLGPHAVELAVDEVPQRGVASVLVPRARPADLDAPPEPRPLPRPPIGVEPRRRAVERALGPARLLDQRTVGHPHPAHAVAAPVAEAGDLPHAAAGMGCLRRAGERPRAAARKEDPVALDEVVHADRAGAARRRYSCRHGEQERRRGEHCCKPPAQQSLARAPSHGCPPPALAPGLSRPPRVPVPTVLSQLAPIRGRPQLSARAYRDVTGISAALARAALNSVRSELVTGWEAP